MLAEAKDNVNREGLTDRIQFILSDVSNKFPTITDKSIDVVWGEDAWCYVKDKGNIIREAARVLVHGGMLAFTDWIEGDNRLLLDEAKRINKFMCFPYMETKDSYVNYIQEYGFKLVLVEDLNSHYVECIKLYIDMLTKQLTYDALQIILENEKVSTFDEAMVIFKNLGNEMQNMLEKAEQHKISRGRFIAIKS